MVLGAGAKGSSVWLGPGGREFVLKYAAAFGALIRWIQQAGLLKGSSPRFGRIAHDRAQAIPIQTAASKERLNLLTSRATQKIYRALLANG